MNKDFCINLSEAQKIFAVMARGQQDAAASAHHLSAHFLDLASDPAKADRAWNNYQEKERERRRAAAARRKEKKAA